MTKGVLAVIYDKSIWEDPEAVIALSSLGNFNAAIDQGEDEMQAFGRINELVNRMNDTEWKDTGDIPVSAILEGVKEKFEWFRTFFTGPMEGFHRSAQKSDEVPH